MYNQKQIDALNVINEVLISRNVKPLDESEIKGLDITGNEDESDLKDLAFEIISEEASVKAENKFWAQHDWQLD